MGDEAIRGEEPAGSSGKPDGLLYHYTDQRGLMGILGDQVIWATHVRHLNDESEFTHAWDKSWTSLLSKLQLRELPGKDSSFNRSLEKVYLKTRETFDGDPQRKSYFVFSLTDDRAADSGQIGFDGDRLSQWRGYSRGSSGFSLGFDADLFESSFTATGKVIYWLRRCVYSEVEQAAAVDGLTDRHLDAFLNAWQKAFTELRDPSLSPSENARNYGPHLMEPIMDMYADFIQFGMFAKHYGFQEENEWRVSFITEDRSLWFHREGRFGPAPYIKIGVRLNGSPSPLKRVVVGPGPHKIESVESVKQLLAKSAIADVEVIASRIPYRTW